MDGSTSAAHQMQTEAAAFSNAPTMGLTPHRASSLSSSSSSSASSRGTPSTDEGSMSAPSSSFDDDDDFMMPDDDVEDVDGDNDTPSLEPVTAAAPSPFGAMPEDTRDDVLTHDTGTVRDTAAASSLGLPSTPGSQDHGSTQPPSTPRVPYVYFDHRRVTSEGPRTTGFSVQQQSVKEIFQQHWARLATCERTFREAVVADLSVTDATRHRRLVNVYAWTKPLPGASAPSQIDILFPEELLAPPPTTVNASNQPAKGTRRRLRPHQVEGVRFMWRCLVDCPHQALPTPRPPQSPLTSLPTLQGYGCILAHSMGLGKTGQVTVFLNMFFEHILPKARVIVVTPKSTLSSWENEIHSWSHQYHTAPPQGQSGSAPPTGANTASAAAGAQTSGSKQEAPHMSKWAPLPFHTFVFRDDLPRKKRVQMARVWDSRGGIMIIGYEGLISLQKDLLRAQAQELHQNAATFAGGVGGSSRGGILGGSAVPCGVFRPDRPVDLVVCDEAHRLKGNDLLILEALQRTYPQRRLLLTGTPMQNHLTEYYTMIQFALPNFFEKKWFSSFFRKPIELALEAGASAGAIDVAKKKTFALIKEVEPFVQRVDSSPLRDELPPLHEFVIVMTFTPLQKLLYQQFLQLLRKKKNVTQEFNLLQANAYANRICAHPQLLFQLRASHDELNASFSRSPAAQGAATATTTGTTSTSPHKEDLPYFDVTDDDEDEGSNSQRRHHRSHHSATHKHPTHHHTHTSVHSKSSTTTDKAPVVNEFATFFDVPQHYVPSGADSAKFAAALHIIAHAKELGEKVLVFSMSTQLLDLFQQLLRQEVPEVGYCRIDGSTSSADRAAIIAAFEQSPATAGGSSMVGGPDVPLTAPTVAPTVFLLSTKAGGVGLTLTAATRVVIMDTSFNPADDRQAVGRAYRYGQQRPVYVYRLVCEDSFEHRLLYQKVAKEWLFQTVVDTKHIKRDRLAGMRIRDALTTTTRAAPPANDPAVMRGTAACIATDPAVLGTLRSALVSSVMTHQSFFEEGADVYGDVERRWYDDYRKHQRDATARIADDGGELAAAALDQLLGVFSRVPNAPRPLADSNLPQAQLRQLMDDPRTTIQQLRRLNAASARSLTDVIDRMLEERQQQRHPFLGAGIAGSQHHHHHRQEQHQQQHLSGRQASQQAYLATPGGGSGAVQRPPLRIPTATSVRRDSGALPTAASSPPREPSVISLDHSEPSTPLRPAVLPPVRHKRPRSGTGGGNANPEDDVFELSD